LSGAHFQTAPQFDSSGKFATTEFVQRALGSHAGSNVYNGNTALTSSDVGRLVVVSGTSATLTLPDAGACPLGSLIPVLASTTVGLNVQAKAGQTLITLSGLSGSQSLLPSSMAVYRKLNDGTGWILEGGDAALKYSPLFASSLTASRGWAKRPDGLIEQFGIGVTDANGYVYITYPIGFLSAVRNVHPVHFGSQSLMHAVMDVGFGLGGCTLRVQSAAGAAQAGWQVFWRALGY
jgi:hypothetical protein